MSSNSSTSTLRREHILNRSPSWWQAMTAISVLAMGLLGGYATLRSDQAVQSNVQQQLLAATQKLTQDVGAITDRIGIVEYQNHVSIQDRASLHDMADREREFEARAMAALARIEARQR